MPTFKIFTEFGEMIELFYLIWMFRSNPGTFEALIDASYVQNPKFFVFAAFWDFSQQSFGFDCNPNKQWIPTLVATKYRYNTHLHCNLFGVRLNSQSQKLYELEV